MWRLFALYSLLISSLAVNAQNLPDAWQLDPAYHHLTVNGQHSTGFYDESQMQTIQLWFSQPDYWQQMTANYASKTNIPATMVVGTDTFPNVGVRFKGNTSYNMVQNSQKKSFNITLDYIDPTQDIDGYETLNLNNAFEDASFMREVAYLHQIRKHVPAARANYVHLYINGAYWGVYPNVQQLNRQYLKEWFSEEKGTLWRADRPSGTGGPGGPGGPGWGDGTAAINFLGTDTATYKQYYTLKSTDDPTPWDELVKVCDKLNNTPAAQLEDTIRKYMDLDRTLWFMASEIAFSDDDSYVFKGKMDYYIYYNPQTGFLTPLEFDGNSVMKSSATNWSVFYNATKVNYPLLNKLLAVPSIRQRYLAHMRTLVQDELDPAYFNALIDQYDALINAAVQADTKKLYSYTQYTSEKAVLKSFVNTHRTTLLNNTEMQQTAPTISQTALYNIAGNAWAAPVENEAAVVRTSVTNAEGVSAVWLWYSASLEGQFSRVQMFDDGGHDDGAANDGSFGASIPGFAFGTQVRFYVEALSANAAKSAAYDPVGAEHDVYYYQVTAPFTSSQTVVINEIMASNTSTVTDDAGEYDDWIELYNRTNQAVDLAGYGLSDNPANLFKWVFSAGSFIAPNGYFIVWADEDGGTEGPLHASFKLSADGETLTLADPQGNLLDTLTFGTQVSDKGYARVPNGYGPFVIKSPTFAANNGTVSTFELLPAADWSVTPTVTSSVVRISMKNGAEAVVQVMDMLGNTLVSELFQSETTLSVASFPAGTYTVRIVSGGKTGARRVIVP